MGVVRLCGVSGLRSGNDALAWYVPIGAFPGSGSIVEWGFGGSSQVSLLLTVGVAWCLCPEATYENYAQGKTLIERRAGLLFGPHPEIPVYCGPYPFQFRFPSSLRLVSGPGYVVFAFFSGSAGVKTLHVFASWEGVVPSGVPDVGS